MSRSKSAHRSSSSSSNLARLRRAAGPQIENLEGRLLNSVSSAVVNGELIVTGGDAAEIVTLDHTGKTTFVNGKAFADQTFNLIEIDTGGGNDTVDVRRLARDLRIQTGAGANVLKIGNNGLLSGVQAGVLVRDSATGTLAVTVDDSANAAATKYKILANETESQIQFGPTGDIDIGDVAISTLTVNGGSGGNDIVVSDTPPRADQTIVNSGRGKDLVKIERARSALIVHGQAGLDRVTVGATGDLTGVTADVSIDNLASFTAVEIDDSADTVARTLTLDIPKTAAGFDPVATFTGVTDATIRVTVRDLDSLRVRAGSGGNTVTVKDVVGGRVTTNLNTGAGDDTTVVAHAHGQLNLNGGGGVDHVTIGANGHLDGFTGLIQVTNVDSELVPAGVTALVIDGSADTAPHTVGLNVNGNVGEVAGLTDTLIRYAANQTSGLLVRTGAGDNHVVVRNTVGPITQLFTGAGNNTIDVLGTTDLLDIGGADGHDTVNLGGQANSVRNLLGDVQVTHAGGGFVDVNVNDQADAAPRAVVMTVSPTGEFASIAGLAPGDLRLSAGSIRTLTVNAGGGGNSFDIIDTPDDLASTTVINTGAGVDAVRVRALRAPLTINGQAGRDTVLVAPTAGDLGAGLRADLTILNTGSFTHVTVDDSADDLARAVTMDVVNGPGGAPFGVVSGFGQGEIRYKVNDLASLTVLGGRGGNTFTIADTARNGINPLTTLKSGVGNDTVNVLRTTGILAVQGQAGADTVNLGLNGNAQAIAGDLAINNAGGLTAITVDDRADVTARSVTLTTAPGNSVAAPASLDSTIVGLTPAVIRYTTRDLASLTVNAGNGGAAGNTFDVNGTAAGRTGRAVTTVNTGDASDRVNVFATTGALVLNTANGNDVVTVGNFANSLGAIQGDLTVNAGTGQDALTLNDQGGGPREFTQDDASVQRDGAAAVRFAGVETLKVNKGVGSTSQTSAPKIADLAFTKAVKPGKLAKIAGRLVDKDKQDKLSITVDWGDGSAPQKFAPGRKAFVLKHAYAKAGKYAVKLVWTDNTGKSNAQTLKVTAQPAAKPATPKPAPKATPFNATTRIVL